MQDHVPYGVFIGFAWAIICIGAWFLFYSFNRRERMRIYEMIEKASAEGRTLPPEITSRLARRWQGTRTWISDLRSGLIFLAVGVGLAAGGLINYYDYGRTHPHSDLFHGPFALFPVPALVGVAFLIMAIVRRRDERLD
jgi:hypothetical protein